MGFEGAIVADPSKPDGTPQKLMAVDRLRSLGWSPHTSLTDGLALTYSYISMPLISDEFSIGDAVTFWVRGRPGLAEAADRLVVEINFRKRIVWIKWFGTTPTTTGSTSKR